MKHLCKYSDNCEIEHLCILSQDNRKWISVEQLKEGYLYTIRARNSMLGIWNPNPKFVGQNDTGGFEISRFKHGRNCIFVEYHYDLDKMFGTAKPYDEIEKVPEFESSKEKLDYLNRKAKELIFCRHIEEGD